MPEDKISHVIVLMLENRSFDHILGCLQQVKPSLDGIAPGGPTRTNEYSGKTYDQASGAGRYVEKDPMHEYPHVRVQLEKDSNGKDNSGFVKDYAQSYPGLSSIAWSEVIKFHDIDALPALHALAKNFLVCDRWFSSVPGPTWPNRLFAMTGTSLGRVSMPEGIMDLNFHWYDQPTLFDRLNEQGKSWRVYYGDTPLSLILVHQLEPENVVRHRLMTEFYEDAAGSAKDFPDFAWIEPAYLEPGANDDHPPHDVLEGEVLVAQVYNALRANSELWESSLLVVLFDEHGGFYDHVPPPATVAPDHHQEEYTFGNLGVRVPAILVSPWVENGVLHDEFDHTSLLKYLIDKWHLGSLGNRAAQAKTFSGKIRSQPRDDTPQTVPLPQAGMQAQVPPRKTLTSNQSAIIALSHALESMSHADPNVVAARSQHVLSGPQSQIDAAVDRVEAFLDYHKLQVER